MRSDLAARLRQTMRGGAIAEKGVTGVAGVTGPIGLRLKPQQLRQLRPLRHENGNGEKRAREGVSAPVTQPIGADFVDAIEERAAIISETCPAPYAETFARLNHQKPFAVSDARLAASPRRRGPVSRRLGNARGENAMERERPVRRPARGQDGPPCVAALWRAR